MSEFPYAQIIAEAARDRRFRARLVADPNQAVASLGIKVDDGVEVRVIEDSLKQVHAVLPEQPGWRGPETGVVATVLGKFRTNQHFRRQVLRNPKEAYRDLTGFALPAQPKIVAVVETPRERIVQLLPVEVQGAQTFAEVQNSYGGDLYAPEGTYESGQACNCFTDELASIVTACCLAEPEEQPL